MSSFREFARKSAELSRVFRGMSKAIRDARREGQAPRGNRWNTIGRTRRKCAEILTIYIRSIEGADGKSSYPDATVRPEDISQMRLVGKVRAWEDAHCWEAWATIGDEKRAGPMLYSYSTMTEIVKAGRVLSVGDDGEVCA